MYCDRQQRNMFRQRLLKIQMDLMTMADDFEPCVEKFSDTDEITHQAMLDVEKAIERIQERFA